MEFCFDFRFNVLHRLAEGPMAAYWMFVEWQEKMLKCQNWGFEGKRSPGGTSVALVAQFQGAPHCSLPISPTSVLLTQPGRHTDTLFLRSLSINLSFVEFHVNFHGSRVECRGGHTLLISFTQLFDDMVESTRGRITRVTEAPICGNLGLKWPSLATCLWGRHFLSLPLCMRCGTASWPNHTINFYGCRFKSSPNSDELTFRSAPAHVQKGLPESLWAASKPSPQVWGIILLSLHFNFSLLPLFLPPCFLPSPLLIPPLLPLLQWVPLSSLPPFTSFCSSFHSLPSFSPFCHHTLSLLPFLLFSFDLEF